VEVTVSRCRNWLEAADLTVKGKTEKGRSSGLGVLGMELKISHLKK
jgi:hypothetical protein